MISKDDFKMKIDSATTEDEIDALCRLWLVRNKPVIEISVKDAAQQLFELLKIRIEDASLTITADGWLLSLYPPAHRYDVGLIPERWCEKRIIIEKIDYPTACKYPLESSKDITIAMRKLAEEMDADVDRLRVMGEKERARAVQALVYKLLNVSFEVDGYAR